jgi:hypothetical protein
MILRSSQPPVTTALVGEPDALLLVTCPMCHTPSSLTQSGLDTGSTWRCDRCGQHWNASRLATVAAYAAWVAEQAPAVVKSAAS